MKEDAAKNTHGIILDTAVTSGEVHDAVPYLKQLEHIHYHVIPIQSAAADAAYDLPLFHRVLRDHNIRFFVEKTIPALIRILL